MPDRATSGRAALITGGTRGIGLGIAQCLAAEGWRLALNGVRNEPDVAEVLDGLRSDFDSEVVYAQGDVSNGEDRARMLDEVRASLGPLDALVNNAGITSPGRKDLLEADEESWNRVFDVNLKGPFFLTQAVARGMVADGRDDSELPRYVVNVTSVSADFVSTNRGDYCLTKAALGMATKLWAARLAEHGVHVFEVRPGVIATDMTAGVKEKYDRLFEQGLALERRWGTPADVGKAVAMLLRGDLPYATGQVLHVDGGMGVRVL